MSEGALTLSRDGIIIYANQTFAGMLQTPLERVIGAALADFLAPADQPALAGLIEVAWGGSSWGELSVRAADGSQVPLRLGLRRLQLGAETLVCAVATDITVEKNREGELRRLADLEARVAERTADLAASRLTALNMMVEAVEGRKTVESANRDLTLEISARKQAEEAIQLALAEKTVMLKEIHHRVKNNLAIMVALINMQVRQIKHPDALAALADTKARLFAMSLLHEMLYRSGRMDRLEITEYLGQLCAYLSESLGMPTHGIQIQSRSSAPVTLEIDQAVPCGLIVSELVSNAFKHAFPEARQGEVIVELEQAAPDGILLRVTDNGIGLPDRLQIDQLNSVGLTLVNALTQQLEGTLEVRSEHGTRVEIRFPLPSTHHS